MSEDNTTEDDVEKILEEIKKNSSAMQIKIKNDKLCSNLSRHSFFIRLVKLFSYFGDIGKVTPLLLSANFGISRQYSYLMLENLCNCEILERQILDKGTIYHFIKNDKGEYYILDLIREGLKYHKKCCINSSNFKIKINKKLAEFSDEAEGDKR